MSLPADEKRMGDKALRKQKLQRLRDKVRIRCDMIASDFRELQQEIEYEARELQAKPLVDPETGLVVDEEFKEPSLEEEAELDEEM